VPGYKGLPFGARAWGDAGPTSISPVSISLSHTPPDVIPDLIGDLFAPGDPRIRSEGDGSLVAEAGTAPDRGAALRPARYRTLWQPRTFALRAQRCRQPKRRPMGPVRRWHGGGCAPLFRAWGMSGNVIPGLTRDLFVRGDPRIKSEGDVSFKTAARTAPDRGGGGALRSTRYRTLWQPRTFTLQAQCCRRPKRRPITPEACRFSMAHLRCDGPVRRWHGGRWRDLDSVPG
jgi:hypothetical protein